MVKLKGKIEKHLFFKKKSLLGLTPWFIKWAKKAHFFIFKVIYVCNYSPPGNILFRGADGKVTPLPAYEVKWPDFLFVNESKVVESFESVEHRFLH